MDCEDGSSVARTVYLSGARLSRRGTFQIHEAAGGNYGPSGRIRLTVAMRGRFTSPRGAEGTFRVSALITESVLSPAVACYTGDNGWVVRR
jgi:hypothetical protein